ncbi:MAG TPA: response regulator transcription factor [Actinomycetes bacterium]|nr:response regulator transcription factor [Actinomycetes bacterium]
MRLTPIRIVVGDDDYLVRQGIERIIAIHEDLEVVASCGHYDALRQAVAEHRPDVVLTDIRMPPGMSDEGIRVASHLATAAPEVGVVVLSQYDEPEYVLALLDAGSDRRSYLLKEKISDVDQLAAAIRTVADGGSVIDPKVVERLVAARARGDSPLAWLTGRESEVLAAMARGMSNAAIAAELHIGTRAVEKHINSIFAKLGLVEDDKRHRRVQAVLTFLSEVG